MPRSNRWNVDLTGLQRLATRADRVKPNGVLRLRDRGDRRLGIDVLGSIVDNQEDRDDFQLLNIDAPLGM